MYRTHQETPNRKQRQYKTQTKVSRRQRENYVVSMCPKIRRMQLECLELLDALTEEQNAKVQEMIDKPMRDRSFNDPQALKFFLKILENVSSLEDNDEKEEVVYLPSYIQVMPPTKKRRDPPISPAVSAPKVPPEQPRYMKDPMAEIIDLYLVLEVEVGNSDAGDPLESLIDGYLEALEFENPKPANREYRHQKKTNIKKDDHKALEWCQKSAKNGNLNGQEALGPCYEKGTRVKKNEYKALACFQKPSNLNNKKIKDLPKPNEGIITIDHQRPTNIKLAVEGADIRFRYQNGISIENDDYSAEMSNANGTYPIEPSHEKGIGVRKGKENEIEIEKNPPATYLKHAENDNLDEKYGPELYQQNGTGIGKDEYKPFIYYQNSVEANAVNKLGSNELDQKKEKQVENVPTGSEDFDDDDTITEEIDETIKRPQMAIDVENLCEACDKWNEKVNELKTWIDETRKVTKRSGTYLKLRDQEPEGAEIIVVATRNSKLRRVPPPTPEVTIPVVNVRPKRKKWWLEIEKGFTNEAKGITRYSSIQQLDFKVFDPGGE